MKFLLFFEILIYECCNLVCVFRCDRLLSNVYEMNVKGFWFLKCSICKVFIFEIFVYMYFLIVLIV